MSICRLALERNAIRDTSLGEAVGELRPVAISAARGRDARPAMILCGLAEAVGAVVRHLDAQSKLFGDGGASPD